MAKSDGSSQSSLSTIEEPFISRNFFSYHYLKERLPKDDSRWSLDEKLNVEAFAKVKELYKNVQPARKDQYTRNEANLEKDFIRPILDILGHNYDVQESVHFKYRSSERPDYTLFPSEDIRRTAQSDKQAYLKSVIGLGEAKAWDLDLDKTVKISPTSFANPSLQINNYLRDTNIGWGILTNGRKWRLYNKETSLQLDSYYEIDLATLVEHGSPEDFKYFFMFFRKESFIIDASGRSFLEDAFTGSIRYARELEEDVKDNVYEALSLLIKGFLDHPDNKLQATEIQEIHENSLILLYRLLFVLYAEAKGLLPLKNSHYAGQSLQRLREDVEIELNKTPLTLTSSGDSFWSRLVSLFRIIDVGSGARGMPASLLIVPPYNGGLFDPQKHPFLEKRKVGDVSLARALHHISWSKGRNGHAAGFVDYTSLSIRHLGSIYEGLLEYKPMVADDDFVVVKKKGHELLKRESELSLTPRQLKQLERIAKGEVYLRTDKGDRKATGSYYTPDYVVKSIVEEAIGPLIDSIAERGHRGMDFVREVLSLKVLDPAMGSGHFLVEATSFLAVRIVEALAETEEGPRPGGDVEVLWARREVARRCIYGVDLNPLAVELAKVSLWLHTVTKDKPLSFLDHHLKCGNSLLGIALADLKKYPLESERKGKKDDTTLPSFISQIFIERLIGKIEQLDVIGDDRLEDIKRKEQILEEFRRLPEYEKTKAIADVSLSASFGNVVAPVGKRTSAEVYYDLVYSLDYPSNWAPKTKTTWFQTAVGLAREKRFFHWELEFPEVFFEKGALKSHPGFDAIVGNPPYIRIHGIGDANTKNFLKLRFRTAWMNFDVYVPFVEQAMRLLSESGRFGYILPTKFFYTEYGSRLRLLLARNKNILKIVDFGHNQVFRGETTYTCLLFLQKKPCQTFDYYRAELTDNPDVELKRELENLDKSSMISHTSYDSSQLGEEAWPLSGRPSLEILRGMETKSLSLAEVCGGTFVGIQTSLDEVYVMELVADRGSTYRARSSSTGKEYDIESRFALKLVSGEDVDRYTGPHPSRVVVFPYEQVNGTVQLASEREIAASCPGIWAYLKENETSLRAREDGKGDTSEWYGYIYRKNLEKQREPKIVVAKIVSRLRAAMDESGTCCLLADLANGIAFDAEEGTTVRNGQYLLALLNSRLVDFVFKLRASRYRGGYYSSTPKYLDLIPIFKVTGNPAPLEGTVKEEIEALHQSFLRTRDYRSWIGFLQRGLGPDSSHSVYLGLRVLSEQMNEMQRKKDGAVAAFLGWVESPLGLGVRIKDLRNKTKLLEFSEASDLGTNAGRQSLEGVFEQNGVRIGQERLTQFRAEYDKASQTLVALIRDITSTDILIDWLVYRLYGLTLDQVAVIEDCTLAEAVKKYGSS